jgi:para-aminobenzoate synthetase
MCCACLHLCRALYDGDSYEVCLTTALVRQGAPHPPTLYRTLRAVNPAPYAAWLHVGGSQGPLICCSSPERFLRGGRGGVLEARPIKGTAARVPGDPAADAAAAAALAGSEKDRAENLMIVDLLRNDLGSVCEVGGLRVRVLRMCCKGSATTCSRCCSAAEFPTFSSSFCPAGGQCACVWPHGD